MDRSLVERARTGDREAFAQIATAVSDRLFALALRVLRDADNAGDALQVALVQIWRDFPSLRDPDRFEAWSYRIMLRTCQGLRRQARRRLATIDLDGTHAAVTDVQASVALQDELEQAFTRLTHEQRAVLVLLYYRGLTINEVAEVLQISPGTVKSRHHSARIAMRAAIDAGSRIPHHEGRPA